MLSYKPGQTASPPFILARGMKDRRKDIKQMLDSLQSVGQYLVTPSGKPFYIDEKTRQVVAIEEGHQGFMKLMGSRHEYCPDKTFIERAHRHALTYGITTNIYRMAHVDTTSMSIYMYSQGTDVFKITAAAISTIQNGDDGVYFLKEPGSVPFSIIDPVPEEDLFGKYIANALSLANTSMEVDQVRFLVISWFCSLFIPEMLPIMPQLVLVGSSSTGKTTFMRLINELLFGNQLAVLRTPADQKAFDSIVYRHRLLCMDNVNEWSPWLDGSLENVARRDSIHIWKGSQLLEQRLDCAIILSARQFPDEALQCINRLLPVVLKKPELPVPERVLIEAVRSNRNVIMTQLMRHLQNLLIDIGLGRSGYMGSYASADFADVAYRLARTIRFEDQAADMLDRLSALHSAALPAEEQVVKLVEIWLSNPANVERKIKATELQKEISVIAKEQGITFSMTGRSFAFWLKASINIIRQFFDVDAWEARSREYFYKFGIKSVQ